MTFPTTAVIATILSPDGTTPQPGARVTAVLSAPVPFEGLLAGLTVSAYTDANGQCTLNLWPNNLSTNPVTTYTIEIDMPAVSTSRYGIQGEPAVQPPPIIYRGVSVPDVGSVPLEELLGGTPGTVTPLTFWDDRLIWNDAAIWTEP